VHGLGHHGAGAERARGRRPRAPQRPSLIDVHFRPVTPDNERECLALRVADDQARFIASNARSLEQAKAQPALVPLAIYPAAARGYPAPKVPMVGFAMYEVDVGVGSILRLMVDARHQRKGYGRAALVELIRRLRLIPEVEMIVASHREDNVTMGRLLAQLGFVPWEITDPALRRAGEIYVRLPRE
jgi:diamine N-acetyltransferase